jgi:L-iditol 2-dehydrogenase
MKAAVMTGIRKIELQERPVPEPGPGEVRLRVTAVGVCGSDVHYYVDGRIGDQVVEGDHVMGHEFAAVVDSLGPEVERPAVGTRVAVEAGRNCQKCEQCLGGRPNLCPNVVFYGTPPVQGAFCEYVLQRADLCFPIPDELGDEDAAMLEPLGIGIHTVRRARADLGDTVAVLGSGPIGLVTMMCARAQGASRILATDIRPYRLDYAKRAGATEVMNPADGDVVEWIMDLTGGRGADVAYECAGEQDTVTQCIGGTRIGGRVGLVGIPRVDRISLTIHTARRRELDILNVRRSRFTVEAGLAMAKSGQVDLRSMITHRMPLEDVGRACDLVDKYADGVVKVMIRVSDS